MSNLNGAEITWLGHATVHIRTPKGTSILIDPFIAQNPKFPKSYRMPATLDLLLVTHGHSDHIADATSIAAKYNPTVVGIVELVDWLMGKGVKKGVGINMGGTYRFQDLTVTLVEAKHSSGIQDGDQMIYGGEPAGFVIAIDDAPVLYHAGDTTVFQDMQLIRELYAPQIGMLPIGGHYTMGPREAAVAVKYLGLKTVLPIHYGTFSVLVGKPSELAALVNPQGVEVKAPSPGETWK